MTLYYNPKTKKPHLWIMLMPAIMPILLTALVILFGMQHLEKKMEEERRQANMDVFEKF